MDTATAFIKLPLCILDTEPEMYFHPVNSPGQIQLKHPNVLTMKVTGCHA